MNSYSNGKRSVASVDVVSETHRHPNAKNLELVCLEFNKTFTLCRTGEFKVGDAVVYLHSGAIMPENCGWGRSGTVEKYLSADRSVKPVTLRGIPSGGVAFSVEEILGDEFNQQIEVPCDVSEKIGVLGTASRTYYDSRFFLQKASQTVTGPKLNNRGISKNCSCYTNLCVIATAILAFVFVKFAEIQ